MQLSALVIWNGSPSDVNLTFTKLATTVTRTPSRAQLKKVVQVKTAYKDLGFLKLASIGSYINGVYCEIRLPRLLIRFLIFVYEKKTRTHA